MTTLRNILTAITPVQLQGDASIEVSGICIDSRKVVRGSVFIAVKGTLSDGHAFIEKSI